MKAKELAEQLLKYPDFEVEFDIMTAKPTHDRPWAEYQSYKVVGIDGVANVSQVIVLDIAEIYNDSEEYV